MTELYIEDISSPTNEEWDSIWKGCDYATYFHSREWAEIWNVYTKGQTYPCPKLFLFSDGKKALLPLSVELVFKGLVKTYLSSPAGTFGGWISTDKLDVPHAKLISDYLFKECPNLHWRLNPYDDLVFKLGIRPTIQDETYSIDLSVGHDAAFKQWRKSQRYYVRRASKLGVLTRPAITSEDWNNYYEVYEDSLRRWGKKASSKYEKNLFEELFRRKSPNIKLWLAIYENNIIGGEMVFCSKKLVVSWHAAALKKYFYTGMVNLLTYETFKETCENGYSWLDFNPCGGHESVRSYKKEFGTKELPSPILDVQTAHKKTLTKALSLARKLGYR